MGFAPSLRRTRTRWVTIAVALIAALFASFLVSAPAHALADTGTGGQFVPLQQRVFDSRTTTWGNAVAPVKRGVWTSIAVAGANGVPADAAAVQVTLTEVDASGNGVVYADKTGVSAPNTSMPYLTWYDTNVSNTAILALGDDGGIQVSTNITSMNLLVDVQGYYTSGDTTAGGYVPLTTATRVWSSGSTKYANGATVDVAIGGQAGVPADASSAMINIIEGGSTSGADGYLVPYATGSTAPSYSSMNWTSGQNAEFSVPVKLGSNGKVTIKIKAGGSVALSVGIQGYFTATDGTAVLTPAHARVYDSRSTAPVAQVPAGGTRKIQVAGVAGVPVMGSGLTAAAVNIYVLSGSTSGHVNVTADDAAMGDDAQQFYTNRITYGFTTVKLGADGGINLKNYASTPIDVLVDVEGWYTNPLAPTISCPAPYAAGSWTTAVPGGDISCSVGVPAASASGLSVSIESDGDGRGVVPIQDASSSAPILVDGDAGQHFVTATVIDSAGNSLAETDYQFGVGNWAQAALLSPVEDGSLQPTEPVLSVMSDGDKIPEDASIVYNVGTDTGTQVVTSGPTIGSWAVPSGMLTPNTNYTWSATVTSTSGGGGAPVSVTTPTWSFTTNDGSPVPADDSISSNAANHVIASGTDSPTVVVEATSGSSSQKTVGVQRTSGNYHVTCTLQTEGVHRSNSPPHNTLFKTRIRCTGYGLSSVRVRIQSAIYFYPAATPTSVPSSQQQRAHIDESEWFAVNGPAQTRYTLPIGHTAGTGTGQWIGITTALITTPQQSNVAVSSKQVWKAIK